MICFRYVRTGLLLAVAFLAIVPTVSAQAPHADCYIKVHGKFVCSGHPSNPELGPSRETPNQWEVFHFTKGGGIRDAHGGYLGLGESGTIKSGFAEAQAFRVARDGDRYVLYGPNGKLVAFVPNGNLESTRDAIGPWERVELLPVPQQDAKQVWINSVKQRLLQALKDRLSAKLNEMAQGNEGKGECTELQFDEHTLKLTGKGYIRHKQHWEKTIAKVGGREVKAEGDTYNYTQHFSFWYNYGTGDGDCNIDASFSVLGQRVPVEFSVKDLLILLAE